jgi:glycosyltransferase involved in cell wall biosynthesis
MKIALMICCMGSGGSGTLIRNLAVYLRGHGHKVDILLLDAQTDTEFELTHTRFLSEAGIHVLSLGRKSHSFVSAVATIFRFWKQHSLAKYDVIHTNSQILHQVAGLLHWTCPLHFAQVATVHNTSERWNRLTRLLAAKATVVYCSKAAADAAPLVNKTYVIANGSKISTVMASAEQAKQLKHALGLPDNSIILLSVGNLRKQKNYLLALNVVKQLNETNLPNIQYLICGEGPERFLLEDEIKRLDLSGCVHLLGVRSDVSLLLSVTDCYLSTSLHEGLPIAVLEAFFAGTKCVLSPIKEHQDISCGIAGCTLPKNMTVDAFIESLTSTLELPNSRKDFIVQRQVRLKDFSFEAMADAYEQHYKLLVNSNIS